jgi:hypothetical protein
LLLRELGLDRRAVDRYQTLFDHANPVPPAGAWQAVQHDASAAWELNLVFVPGPDADRLVGLIQRVVGRPSRP